MDVGRAIDGVTMLARSVPIHTQGNASELHKTSKFRFVLFRLFIFAGHPGPSGLGTELDESCRRSPSKNFSTSNKHNTIVSMAYETVRFLTTAPWGPNFSPNGLLLSFVHQLTAYEDNNDGSHLPMVQPARELQRRVEDMDQAATKYRKKSTECTAALKGDLAVCDDSEVKLLTESLISSHNMLADYLEGLHPILRAHRDSVKRLSEYLTPPTAELFHKKANHILKDAPPQQISMSKKNTCTICMDASADCVIKRTCNDAPSNSSSHHQVRCERDMCKCGPTMCKDCLLTHYWTSTGKGSKSYARCVCCRAGMMSDALCLRLFCT